MQARGYKVKEVMCSEKLPNCWLKSLEWKILQDWGQGHLAQRLMNEQVKVEMKYEGLYITC